MIPREHFKADGKPKKAYPSRDQALRVLAHRKGVSLNAYLCSVCGAWHLGNV